MPDVLWCEQVRADLSAAADGEDVVVDDAHVASCASCAAFASGIRSLRAQLRFDVLDDAPDVAPAVLAAIQTRAPRRRLVPVAAAVLVGALVGAVTAWPVDDGDGIAAADLPARIVAAQEDVASLAARITVVEGDTTVTGTLRFRAPETFDLRLGEVSVTVQDGSARMGDDLYADLEPFDDAVPSPLDLVLPAAAFTNAPAPEVLDLERKAVVVRVTAAQVAAVLAALAPAGLGSTVHPTDEVLLWLDRDSLVPLALEVRAAPGPDRARWAAARGLDVAAGDPVLSMRYDDVVVNDALAVDGIEPVPTEGALDGGFHDGEVTSPVPTWLPDGMTPWRTGVVDGVEVRSWTDGRAWIKVRSTTSWRGGRLFGDVGRAVRVVRLGDGVAYVADGGDAVAVHGAGLDLVVTGSVEPGVLRRVAASLDVAGGRVPADWDEAATVAIDALPAPALVLAAAAGFAAPTARIDGDTVTLTFAGAGERVVVLASRPGDELRPPSDPDAVGVGTRGERRWSPSSGDLEWVQHGRVWSMRSSTVSLAELVALVEGLHAP